MSNTFEEVNVGDVVRITRKGAPEFKIEGKVRGKYDDFVPALELSGYGSPVKMTLQRKIEILKRASKPLPTGYMAVLVTTRPDKWNYFGYTHREGQWYRLGMQEAVPFSEERVQMMFDEGHLEVAFEGIKTE